jgi:hypothetical protein
MPFNCVNSSAEAVLMLTLAPLPATIAPLLATIAPLLATIASPPAWTLTALIHAANTATSTKLMIFRFNIFASFDFSGYELGPCKSAWDGRKAVTYSIGNKNFASRQNFVTQRWRAESNMPELSFRSVDSFLEYLIQIVNNKLHKKQKNFALIKR